MGKYLEALEKHENIGYTANGAITPKSTLNGVLDFFSKVGALRGQEKEALKLFSKAYQQNPILAIKTLFYMRDIRGGQGERATFQYIIKNVASVFEKYISLIPEYGRWDDIYTFIGTSMENKALDVMKKQFELDVKSSSPSLLGKWLKSINTSSQESKELGRLTAKYFGLTEKQYRKTLSSLREKITIIENNLRLKDYDSIEYEKVPSQATKKYLKAFYRNDKDHFESYLNQVKNGEKKINTSTLYPYQISAKVRSYISEEEADALDVLWNNLPNYIDKEENSICVVDTSGSMHSGHSNVAPIDVALSLGIYLAERNKGIFKDSFITFSQNPSLQKIEGENIFSKIYSLNNAEWAMNTNLIAVFELLLNVAVENKIEEEEMIKRIYIISDMQFDAATGKNKKSNFEKIKKMYENSGYDVPQLVFWNVNASDNQPVIFDEEGTMLVSGCSPSIMKNILNGKATTPIDLMLEVLNSERYSLIQ
jgi:hypothetical protein